MNRWIFLAGLFITLFACQDDEQMTVEECLEQPGDLEAIPYEPQPYEVVVPDSFPPLVIPEDNPLTYDGIQLGRHLFYDPILSGDSTLACAGCHFPEAGFTDNKALSKGIQGIEGSRSAMSLVNIGFENAGLFWDGRVATLEEQALVPVEDPIEMHHLWPDALESLRNHPTYPEMFRKAFGITDRSEMTKELAAKAIAQFERIIISGNSKFDKIRYDNDPFVDFTSDEFAGFQMFFDESFALPDAQCFHCHNAPLFTVEDFFNNGLQEAADLNSFEDPGRGAVTGALIDNGKFRPTTLRNITLTAPYMHDGRLETIEDVIDFYSDDVHYSDNLDVNLNAPLGLTETERSQVIAFLHTLVDTSYLDNPLVTNPFKE